MWFFQHQHSRCCLFICWSLSVVRVHWQVKMSHNLHGLKNIYLHRTFNGVDLKLINWWRMLELKYIFHTSASLMCMPTERRRVRWKRIHKSLCASMTILNNVATILHEREKNEKLLFKSNLFSGFWAHSQQQQWKNLCHTSASKFALHQRNECDHSRRTQIHTQGFTWFSRRFFSLQISLKTWIMKKVRGNENPQSKAMPHKSYAHWHWWKCFFQWKLKDNNKISLFNRSNYL